MYIFNCGWTASSVLDPGSTGGDSQEYSSSQIGFDLSKHRGSPEQLG